MDMYTRKVGKIITLPRVKGDAVIWRGLGYIEEIWLYSSHVRWTNFTDFSIS